MISLLDLKKISLTLIKDSLPIELPLKSVKKQLNKLKLTYSKEKMILLLPKMI